MQILAGLVAGILFGAGLTVSQMVDPRKVLDFLDFADIAKGSWDPTLLMVFIGALPTMFVGYVMQRRVSRPALAAYFSIPRRTGIDGRLLAGSAIFGVGWGLSGVCPGPALTSLSLAGGQLADMALFVVAMIAGIMLSWLVAPSSAPDEPATEPRS